ncbi:MAG: PEPxxWA-CTERM sorting domain-containing protein [Caulobacterales bacterium]|nr:PEPxxWA-CTERM sorting domain-containing protein [Caulobacterales bacterium]
MKLTSMVAAVAWVTLGAGAANAATTTYTSSAAFNAAIAGNAVIEDFSSGTAGQVIANGGTFDGATYTTSGGAALDGTIITNQFNSFSGVSLGGYQAGGAAQFFFGGDGVTVTFAAPVYAVGVFFNVNANSGDFVVTAAGGTATAGSGVYDTSTFVFAGLVSDTSFTSATFYSSDGGTHTASYNIPEIITAPAGAAPEPATWAMMLMGFGGLGGMLRRRRAFAGAATA